jgi:hypothetical protein
MPYRTGLVHDNAKEEFNILDFAYRWHKPLFLEKGHSFFFFSNYDDKVQQVNRALDSQ